MTPTGFCSPDAPVRWKGQTLLAYQAYPDQALGGPVSGLFFSVRLSERKGDEPARWGPPTPFLEEALTLSWNTIGRTIDPTMFVGPDGKLHCFLIGSKWLPPLADDGKGPRRKSKKANLLGHAVTDDPELRRWEILTRERPLLGVSERAADGVENVAIFKRRDNRSNVVHRHVLPDRSMPTPERRPIDAPSSPYLHLLDAMKASDHFSDTDARYKRGTRHFLAHAPVDGTQQGFPWVKRSSTGAKHGWCENCFTKVKGDWETYGTLPAHNRAARAQTVRHHHV